eukprot:gene143-854_t
MGAWTGAFFGGLFGGLDRLTDRDHVIRTHEEWIADVRRSVPKGQLLEWDVSQGWAPLCEFLGADVPPEPFPHVNEADEFQK